MQKVTLESLKAKLSEFQHSIPLLILIDSLFLKFIFYSQVSPHLFLSTLVFRLHYTILVLFLFCYLSLLKETQPPNTFSFLIAYRSPWF